MSPALSLALPSFRFPASHRPGAGEHRRRDVAVEAPEFRFPVFSDLMAGVFVDAGNLYFSAEDFQPLALRWNFGAGIRYQTGVGAIALDIGLHPFFRPERGESIVAYPYIYFGLF